MRLPVPFRHNKHRGVFLVSSSCLCFVVVVICGVCGLGVARQWWVDARWESPVSCLLRRFLQLDG